MITFLIAVAALGIALYTLKKLNDCPACNDKKDCCKKEDKE
jgi:hypothetical protein